MADVCSCSTPAAKEMAAWRPVDGTAKERVPVGSSNAAAVGRCDCMGVGRAEGI